MERKNTKEKLDILLYNNFVGKVFAILALVLVLAGGLYFLNRNNLQNPLSPATNNSTLDQETSRLSSTCTEITPSTTEGPYFVSGTQKLLDNNLNFTNLSGTPIKIYGYIYAGKTQTKIANAKIDLWQADNSGAYHPQGNGSISAYSQNQLALRGFINSDENGYFEFTSIYPGFYGGRASHIHVKIKADGFEEKTTQILFTPKGQGQDALDRDSIARGLSECHLLDMNETDGVETGTIDFRLEPSL